MGQYEGVAAKTHHVDNLDTDWHAGNSRITECNGLILFQFLNVFYLVEKSIAS